MVRKSKAEIRVIEDIPEATPEPQNEETIEKPKPKANEFKPSPNKPHNRQPKTDMAQQELVPPKELIEKPTQEYITQFKALQEQMEYLHKKIDNLPQRRVRKAVPKPVQQKEISKPVEQKEQKNQQQFLDNNVQPIPQIMFF